MLYHFAAKIISRAKGQSICAAAAYRSGEKIENDYDGIIHDYRQKENVEMSIVLLPDNAPEAFADRQKLWNAVEQNEKKANAQLGRELEFSLPRELSREERERIALEFVQEYLVKNGMIADVSFHNPPKMNSQKQPVDTEGNVVRDPELFVYNNPHIHVLLPLRPIDENGKWESKRQKLYVCEKNGQQRNFTPSELKDNAGWEKLYSYKDESGEQGWYTKSFVEDHPEKKLAQINRYPKSETIVNPTLEKWNSKDFLMELREAWANKVNLAYEAHGIEERVDHRSYEEQELDLIPSIHEGKAVTIAEKRLKEEYDRKIANGEDAVLQHTDIRNMNIAIQEHNQEIRIVAEMKRLRQQMAQIINPVKARLAEFEQEIAEKLEIIRAELILLGIRIQRAVSLKGEVDERIRFNQAYINDIQPVRKTRIEVLRKEKRLLLEQYESLGPFSLKKREKLQDRIESMDNEIYILSENQKYARRAKQEIDRLQEVSDKADTQIKEMRRQYSRKEDSYLKIESTIPIDQVIIINQRRQNIRPSIERRYVNKKRSYEYTKEAERLDAKMTNYDIKTPHSEIKHQQKTISWD